MLPTRTARTALSGVLGLVLEIDRILPTWQLACTQRSSFVQLHPICFRHWKNINYHPSTSSNFIHSATLYNFIHLYTISSTYLQLIPVCHFDTIRSICNRASWPQSEFQFRLPQLVCWLNGSRSLKPWRRRRRRWLGVGSNGPVWKEMDPNFWLF
jgi:hypothetical protein